MFDGLFRRRRLPHWDVEDATYFITTCLQGSIPAQGLSQLYRYRNELENTAPPKGISATEWEQRKHKLLFARLDKLLDEQPMIRHLKNPEAAELVRNSLLHFAGERYDLLAYVVMPSHFHWLFHPRAEWCESVHTPADPRTPRERIMQSIKGYSAYKCNQLLGLTEAFWQDESYDHVVRNDEELMRIIEYIEQNPVKAGLVECAEEWQWSSALDRHRHGIPRGQPLLKDM